MTLCDLMDCSIPGFPVLHYLPDFARTHVHWVSDTIQPSHPLPPLLPLPSIFPSIRVFPNEVALYIRQPKYWSFSFSISPSYEYSGLISFRMTGLISLLSKGLSRVFNTTVWKHQFFSGQPSLRSNSHISLYISLNKTNKQKKPQDCCSDLSLNAMGACAGPRFESGELVKSPALNKWGWNESLGRILPSGREI